MRTTGEEKLGVNGLALHENGQDEAFPLSTRGPDLQMRETEARSLPRCKNSWQDSFATLLLCWRN